MTEENQRPLVETTLCVRYKGTSNSRVLTQGDLSGEGAGAGDISLVYGPGEDIAWEDWVDLAGSEDRARSVLNQHLHEFEVVGPGADVFNAVEGEEEFSIGGVVE